MRRKAVIGFAVLALLVALTPLGGCGGKEREPGSRQAILIMLDAARPDRFSCYGYGRETTPRLREIAREATIFLDAWSSAGWTSPSHATLITGLRPERHGLFLGNRKYLGPESHTLAEHLADSGEVVGDSSAVFRHQFRFGLRGTFAKDLQHAILDQRPVRPFE